MTEKIKIKMMNTPIYVGHPDEITTLVFLNKLVNLTGEKDFIKCLQQWSCLMQKKNTIQIISKAYRKIQEKG